MHKMMSHPLVNEFSAELLVDQTVFDKAMSDLYLNPRASKFLDDYGTFGPYSIS